MLLCIYPYELCGEGALIEGSTSLLRAQVGCDEGLARPCSDIERDEGAYFEGSMSQLRVQVGCDEGSVRPRGMRGVDAPESTTLGWTDPIGCFALSSQATRG